MAPFITEELYDLLKEYVPATSEEPYARELSQAFKAPLCANSNYPVVVEPKDINPDAEKTFLAMEEVVYTIRNIRGEMKLSPSHNPPIYIAGQEGDSLFELVRTHMYRV
jgi:valyl-tRNA synthetase